MWLKRVRRRIEWEMCRRGLRWERWWCKNDDAVKNNKDIKCCIKKCSTSDLIEMITRWSISLFFLQSFDSQSSSRSQNRHASWYLRFSNNEIYERSCQLSLLFHQTFNVQRTRFQLRHCDRKIDLFFCSLYTWLQGSSVLLKRWKKKQSWVNSTLTSAICCYTYTRLVKVDRAHLLVWEMKHLYACSRNEIRCELRWWCWQWLYLWMTRYEK